MLVATWHLQFFEEPECYMWIAGGSPQAAHGIFGGTKGKKTKKNGVS